MSNKKRGLGKGLNELLSATLGAPFAALQEEATQSQEDSQSLAYLPIDKVLAGPFQPRQQIRHDGLEQLAESIRTQGILQPIVVRSKNDQYEIVAGERRWRAAQLAGLTTVPAIVRQISDEVAVILALIENIQRENLNPIEEATAMKRLADDLQFTHLQVAEAVGKSRVSVTNLLRLLSLNPEVQTLLEQEQIEMGHARALLGLKGEVQTEIAQTVIKQGLSVRETERLVGKLQDNTAFARSPIVVIDPNIRRLEEDLADKLGAQVAIRHHRNGKGSVVIRYNDVEELEGILGHMK